jgi:hypothetical protein
MNDAPHEERLAMFGLFTLHMPVDDRELGRWRLRMLHSAARILGLEPLLVHAYEPLLDMKVIIIKSMREPVN